MPCLAWRSISGRCSEAWAEPRIALQLMARYKPLVKTGVPGVASVPVAPGAERPEHFNTRLPEWQSTTAAPSSG